MNISWGGPPSSCRSRVDHDPHGIAYVYSQPILLYFLLGSSIVTIFAVFVSCHAREEKNTIPSFTSAAQSRESVFGSGPVNHTTSWQPEPTFRGTFRILSTCLITLGLCVWSSLHLNIPGRNEAPVVGYSGGGWYRAARHRWPFKYLSWPGQLIRKLGWMVLAFLAPELV